MPVEFSEVMVVKYVNDFFPETSRRPGQDLAEAVNLSRQHTSWKKKKKKQENAIKGRHLTLMTIRLPKLFHTKRQLNQCPKISFPTVFVRDMKRKYLKKSVSNSKIV